MFEGIFLYRDAGLRAADRFFAANFVSYFQTRLVPRNVKAFSSALRVNDRAVSPCLERLVGSGLLNQEGSGRRICYRFNPEKIRGLSDSSDSDPVGGLLPNKRCRKLVGEILGDRFRDPRATNQFARSCEGEAEESNTRSLLTVDARVLLCVLICHSDRNGVVKGLWHDDLLQLTGLSSSRIRNHVQALVQKRFLSYYVPGFSAPGKEGVSGLYFLRPLDPAMKEAYEVRELLRLGHCFRLSGVENVVEKICNFSCLVQDYEGRAAEKDLDQLYPEYVDVCGAVMRSPMQVYRDSPVLSSGTVEGHKSFVFSDVASFFAVTNSGVRKRLQILVAGQALWIVRYRKQLMSDQGLQALDLYTKKIVDWRNKAQVSELSCSAYKGLFERLEQALDHERWLGRRKPESRNLDKLLVFLVWLSLHVSEALCGTHAQAYFDSGDSFLVPHTDGGDLAFDLAVRTTAEQPPYLEE